MIIYLRNFILSAKRGFHFWPLFPTRLFCIFLYEHIQLHFRNGLILILKIVTFIGMHIPASIRIINQSVLTSQVNFILVLVLQIVFVISVITGVLNNVILNIGLKRCKTDFIDFSFWRKVQCKTKIWICIFWQSASWREVLCGLWVGSVDGSLIVVSFFGSLKLNDSSLIVHC